MNKQKFIEDYNAHFKARGLDDRELIDIVGDIASIRPCYSRKYVEFKCEKMRFIGMHGLYVDGKINMEKVEAMVFDQMAKQALKNIEMAEGKTLETFPEGTMIFKGNDEGYFHFRFEY